MLLHLAAMMVAGYGAYTDLRYHKIYNKLTYKAMLIGFICNLVLFGADGFINSLLGGLAGATFVLLWILGMLKAGDIKLYMAVGVISGWKFCSYSMVFSVLFGGVAAVFLMLIRKNGRSSFKRLKKYFLHLLYTKKFYTYQPEEQSAYFSFGFCIFVGTLFALWYINK